MRLELTTLALLVPRSDQLSYRALFDENAQSSQSKGWRKTRNIGSYLYIGNQVKKISSIPKISLIDRKDKPRTKLWQYPLEIRIFSMNATGNSLVTYHISSRYSRKLPQFVRSASFFSLLMPIVIKLYEHLVSI